MTDPSSPAPGAAALIQIANGRLDGGRPLSGEDARQIARQALIAEGKSWRVPMAKRRRGMRTTQTGDQRE